MAKKQASTTVRPEPVEGQPRADPATADHPELVEGPEPVEGQPVAYLVTAQVEGFRRAGRAWSKTQTRVEAADLQDGQLDALQAEPMLEVVGVAE